jgi:hypothetical protein
MELDQLGLGKRETRKLWRPGTGIGVPDQTWACFGGVNSAVDECDARI